MPHGIVVVPVIYVHCWCGVRMLVLDDLDAVDVREGRGVDAVPVPHRPRMKGVTVRC